jgi:exodeoxyribonuclease-5
MYKKYYECMSCNYNKDITDKLIIKQEFINKIWKEYNENKINLKSPICYTYSITIHKSQGSNYEKVFVDLNNIYYLYETDSIIKACYTAVSRASISIYMLSQ